MTIFNNLNNFWHFWQFWQFLHFFYKFDNFNICLQFWQFLTIFTIAFAIMTIENTILETCDIWDTDYNSDNWEPEVMTIFVTWQLIVTLDSIRNSCDVLENGHHLSNQPQNCEMSINSVKLWSSNSKTTFKCSARYFLGHLWKNRMMLQLWLLMDERKCFPMWNTIHLFFVFVVRNLPQICHWTLLMFSNDTKYSSTLG